MAKFIEQLRKHLALAETAPVTEVRAAVGRMLDDDMTPEEKEEEERKKREKAEADAAHEKEMGELRTVFGLGATVKLAEVIVAAKALKDTNERTLSEKAQGDRQLTDRIVALELRDKALTEEVSKLKPLAEKAGQLELKDRQSTKDRYFSEWVRDGKLSPADREFYEKQYERAPDEVVSFFDKKPKGEQFLTEPLGFNEPDPATRTLGDEGDPLAALDKVATEIMSAENVQYSEALERAKKKKPELAKAVGAIYRSAARKQS